MGLLNSNLNTRFVLGMLTCLVIGAGQPIVQAAPADEVTYTEHVAPILMTNCVTCHRPDQVAPMSLMTYEETRPWARSIRNEVAQRRMPPWHAESGVQDYTNDVSLSDSDVDVILRWVDAGAPKGDDRHMPSLPAFNDSWQLGEPDVILSMNAPYEIEPDGNDEYRCFVLDPEFETDQWIDVVEVLPGNRTTDHHIVLYVDRSGEIATQRDQAEPGEGYSCFGSPGFFAYMVPGWGPGYEATVTPPTSGYRLEAGAKIVMQMHYHKSGKPEQDLTRVGLRLAKNSTSKVLYNGYILSPFLKIPPGDPNHVVPGRYQLQEDITVYSVVAHMHYLGKAMDIWAALPDGSQVDLLKVPRFDFSWQREYTLKEPVSLPKGTMMHMEATFDNSPESPYQHSDPPRVVTFGEETTDEMAVAVFFHTLDAENLAEESDN